MTILRMTLNNAAGAGSTRSRIALCLATLSTCSLLMTLGCAAGPKDTSPTRLTDLDAKDIPVMLKNEPIAYLRMLKERCQELDAYRLTFYRQERLGLFAKLQPMERIEANFRAEPFSVKFVWPDEDMPYHESVYVDGKNDNKLRIRERVGVLGFAPQVREVDIQLPVQIGKAKNPITDFGLARLTSRTLMPFEDPETAEVMTISYDGLVDLGPMHVPAHHLRIERPQMEGYRYTRQDLFIDAQTQWPAGTDLWLPNGKLDARYRYTQIETDVHFTDEDFKLSEPKEESADSDENGKEAAPEPT